jgi:hypothetical protein
MKMTDISEDDVTDEDLYTNEYGDKCEFEGRIWHKKANPEAEDEEMDARLKEESDAERRLMTTPAAHSDQWFVKFQAFECILAEELLSGPRSDSVLMLTLGSLKADC